MIIRARRPWARKTNQQHRQTGLDTVTAAEKHDLGVQRRRDHDRIEKVPNHGGAI